MIRILHGDDEFGISEAVHEMRASLGEEAAVSNTVEFDGRNFKPGEVEAAARAVPFLADRRLVLVRGWTPPKLLALGEARDLLRWLHLGGRL